jgi:transposase
VEVSAEGNKSDRLILTAIWYVLRTGLPWRDVPAYYGPWGTVYTRFRRWRASGLFARMLRVLARKACGALRHLSEMEKHIAKAVEVAKRYGINRKSVVSAVNDYFE